MLAGDENRQIKFRYAIFLFTYLLSSALQVSVGGMCQLDRITISNQMNTTESNTYDSDCNNLRYTFLESADCRLNIISSMASAATGLLLPAAMLSCVLGFVCARPNTNDANGQQATLLQQQAGQIAGQNLCRKFFNLVSENKELMLHFLITGVFSGVLVGNLVLVMQNKQAFTSNQVNISSSPLYPVYEHNNLFQIFDCITLGALVATFYASARWIRESYQTSQARLAGAAAAGVFAPQPAVQAGGGAAAVAVVLDR